MGELEGRKWGLQLTQAPEPGILTPSSGGNIGRRARLLGETVRIVCGYWEDTSVLAFEEVTQVSVQASCDAFLKVLELPQVQRKAAVLSCACLFSSKQPVSQTLLFVLSPHLQVRKLVQRDHGHFQGHPASDSGSLAPESRLLTSKLLLPTAGSSLGDFPLQGMRLQPESREQFRPCMVSLPRTGIEPSLALRSFPP